MIIEIPELYKKHCFVCNQKMINNFNSKYHYHFTCNDNCFKIVLKEDTCIFYRLRFNNKLKLEHFSCYQHIKIMHYNQLNNPDILIPYFNIFEKSFLNLKKKIETLLLFS